MAKTKNEIDFITADKDIINKVNLGRYHRMVACRVKLPSKRKHFNKTRKDITEIQVEIKNQLQFCEIRTAN